MDRRAKLLFGLDTSALEGAEIGALCRPIVKKGDGSIFYIDYADAAALKEKYKGDPGVNVDEIVEVDGLWGENTVQDALGSDRKLDYVIASHVIEHIPDFVSWLHEISSVLKPDGTIRLAAPDKRYCFDYLRRESSLADILTAHFNHARRPNVREVIDFTMNYTPVLAADAWSGAANGYATTSREVFDYAMSLAELAKSGHYIDVHCWVFTPYSFAEIMEGLSRIGLLKLKCEAFFDTEFNDLEFFLILRPCDDRDAIIDSWSRVRAEVTKGGASYSDPALSDLLREATQLTDQLADMRNETSQLMGEVAALRNSTSWRITQPVRWLVERIRRQ